MPKLIASRILVILCALGLAGALGSCSEDGKQAGKGKKKGADEGGEANPATPGDPANPGDDTADPADDADDDDDAGDDETLEQVLADCGGGDAAKAGPDDVIYEKSLKSLPIVTSVLGGLIAKVTAESTLDIKVTGSKTVQDSKVTVKSIEGLGGSIAKGKADAAAAANSGATTLTNVPISEYGNLSEHKQYEDIVCTIVPVTKVENDRGGKKTVAEFDPPVASSISPRAIAKRYKTELGSSKTFDDIKVKIVETDNPDLSGTTSITGKVTVTKVATSAEVDDGKGGKVTVKGDVAYKVTYSFKDEKTTYALGFPPSVTYYISTSKHDLTTNVVDTTALENGGIAVFQH
jgi:hypothetical protein